jgi:KDO2-lipid IV(A) lauroyltransferase
VSTLTLSRISKVDRKITVIDENKERLDNLLNSGKGFVAVTGHLGHWEIMVVDFAFRGIPLSAVVKPLHNGHLSDHIVRTRSASGLNIIFTSKRTQREVIKRLNGGEVVVFVADQDARQFGTFVDFFGRPASTHRGPAMFALRTGLPMLPVFTYWEEGVTHRAIYGEPIYPPENPPDTDLAIQEMTQAFTRQLEALARRVPEQYFWVHKRWKTKPEMLKAKRLRRAGLAQSEAD